MLLVLSFNFFWQVISNYAHHRNKSVMRGIFILGTLFGALGHLRLNIYEEIICKIARMIVKFITAIIGRKLSLVLYGVMLYQPRAL